MANAENVGNSDSTENECSNEISAVFAKRRARNSVLFFLCFATALGRVRAHDSSNSPAGDEDDASGRRIQGCCTQVTTNMTSIVLVQSYAKPTSISTGLFLRPPSIARHRFRPFLYPKLPFCVKKSHYRPPPLTINFF